MKWGYTKPNVGDTRIVRKFAWFPTEVEDKKVWLETYQTEEVYSLFTTKTGTYHEWREYRDWDHENRRMVFPKRKLLFFTIA